MRLVDCVLRFRVGLPDRVDTARLVDDAHGLIFDRSLALDLTTDSTGWGFTWSEFDREILSIKIGLDLDGADHSINFQAAVACVVDVLQGIGDLHLSGISAYLPQATLRPAPALGGPLWLGDGNTPGTQALTATAAVDRGTPAQLADLVRTRVQASRIIRFGPAEQVPLPDELATLAATDPAEFSLPSTEPPVLSSVLQWPITAPVANADAAAWTLAKLIDAIAHADPRPHVAVSVTW
ncbi:hypothetical protein B0O41_0691 [Propionibacteriaceae bacterium ES.041]|uniref:hypothetical protein n=1 Tax=Enemella evansiae TaxID=2016499 RepID=UPI000B9745BE|nr:hypothetical protein [Enemella evansiae]OYO03230.1 hypothetical protein CGZ96_00990 [Enemella evansiae]PFG65916.1 hypothetical protein B0O41_0691 [Propionibacteriaceae bacterium ES.041]